MTMDETKLHELLGAFVTDLGGSFHAINAVIGDRLGLYTALADAMPATPAEVAKQAGVGERYVLEWLRGQAAGGYVTYDATSRTFSLTEEQRFALADPAGMQIAAAFHLPIAVTRNIDQISDAIRSDAGFGWHQHDPELFEGTERFFRPGYLMNLVPSWIPALDGVEAKLQAGARVADVGCGHGASTILLGQSFPNSTVTGFDYHAPSIEWARDQAAAAGAGVSFDVASAADFPGADYDLVAIFDALHDMPDPVGAATHVRAALAPDGTFLLVEPMAGDDLTDNLNPVGRLYYGASTVICVAHSLTEEPRTALGAQAGEARLSEILRAAGFTRIRRAAETPFNLVLEARP